MNELKVEKKVDEGVKEIAEVGKVTDERIEKSLNYDLLTDVEKKAIDEFNEKLNIEDSTEILQYGLPAQEKISKFSDSILENVKTKNTGEVGELLADLVSQIKAFDADVAGTGKRGFFEKSELLRISFFYSVFGKV